jgi:hypothetical protein
MTSSVPKETKFPEGFNKLNIGGVKLLTDPIANESLKVLEDRLASSYTSENFDFLKAVYACYQEKDPKKIQTQIQDIIDTFVKVDSLRPVNLTSDQIKAITTEKNPKVDVFGSAVANISALLNVNHAGLKPKIEEAYKVDQLNAAINDISTQLNTFAQNASTLDKITSRLYRFIAQDMKTMQKELNELKQEAKQNPAKIDEIRLKFEGVCSQHFSKLQPAYDQFATHDQTKNANQVKSVMDAVLKNSNFYNMAPQQLAAKVELKEASPPPSPKMGHRSGG